MPPAFLVHSHLRWDFVWQRPQQTFSRLATDHGHRIGFLEEPMPTEGAPSLELTEPHDGILRIVPRLPGGPDVDTASAAVFDLLQAPAYADALGPLLDAPVQWFYSPMTAPAFIGKFDDAAVVYDCMDELANFRFAPADLVERETFLLRRADVVFTGGTQLYESKARRHRNVHCFGCGVDVEHFGHAHDPAVPEAPEIATLPHPRLGWYGVIDERLDYDLIAALADAFPEGAIVMVGPVVKVDPASLPQRPNLHWLGQRAYTELPALVKGFDVCLMPFAINDATRYINPTKTLEYMAAGKPIVSTPVADVVRNFTPIVDVADTPEAFVAAVRRALRHPRDAAIAAGLERAAAASWDATVAAMRRHVVAAIDGTPTGDTMELHA